MTKKLLSLIMGIIVLAAGIYFNQDMILEEFNLTEEVFNENIKLEEVYLDNNLSTLSVANWNLQIFGQSKADEPELMQIYESYIESKDIVFIQEIRDSKETAFNELCNRLDGYECLTSSRAGRSNSKEQYGVIYRQHVELVSLEDFNPDEEDRWERPPVKVTFLVQGKTYQIYNIHTKPDEVPEEMEALTEIVTDEDNTIILGDLNADCNYYNNVKETHFDDWNWIINDNADTTVSQTDCAYDRIILNDEANDKYISSGIEMGKINKTVSDHYAIYVELKT